VARAIAASGIPVVSCVGHETDVTIADLVADLRAPTPSAAAELAVPEKQETLDRLEGLAGDMGARINDLLARLETRLTHARLHPFLQSPHRMYEERIRRVDEISLRLPSAMRRILQDAQKNLRLQAEKLDAFSPLKVLSRGYAIAEKIPSGEILRSHRQMAPGDPIRVRLHEGEIHCEVKSTHGH